MSRATEEVDRVVGSERAVEETDLPQLLYIEVVVQESQRMYPICIAQMLVAHCAIEDTWSMVAGYDVPVDTVAFINAWAFGRNPRVWPEPHRFSPERFLQGPDAAGPDAHWTGAPSAPGPVRGDVRGHHHTARHRHRLLASRFSLVPPGEHRTARRSRMS